MSKKDFDKYYDNISAQYAELQEVLADLSQEVSTGMIEPERIEQLKLTIKPVENSYRTLSYIKYLLDKPKRASKQRRYSNRSKNLLLASAGHTQEEIEKENKSIIDNLTL